MHDALQVFPLFMYETRNAGDFFTLYVNALMPLFSKFMLNTLFRDFT